MVPFWADLIGRPFKYGGRPADGPAAPLDCFGLVQEVSRRLGVHLPDRAYSSNHEIISALIGVQMYEWRRVDPQVGSVLLFKIRGVHCHVGIQIDEFHFLHTWEKSGGVCREPIALWEKRIEGHYWYVRQD